MPDNVFRMYDLEKHEIQSELDFDNQDGERWWSFEPLNYLDLSSNCIKEIPGDIKMFEDLSILNVSNVTFVVMFCNVSCF